jgi:hypothetical protein
MRDTDAFDIAASRFGETGMNMWRQEMKDKKRSPLTIQTVESNFRTKVRQAKLGHLVPRLDLALRGPTRYRQNGGSRTASLEADIDAKIKWKTDPLVEDRDAKYRIRPVTAGTLPYPKTDM